MKEGLKDSNENVPIDHCCKGLLNKISNMITSKISMILNLNWCLHFWVKMLRVQCTFCSSSSRRERHWVDPWLKPSKWENGLIKTWNTSIGWMDGEGIALLWFSLYTDTETTVVWHKLCAQRNQMRPILRYYYSYVSYCLRYFIRILDILCLA